MKSFRDIPKTGDDEIDSLVEKLLSPWDSGPSGGDEMVVNADIAHDAAYMILKLYKELQIEEKLAMEAMGHI